MGIPAGVRVLLAVAISLLCEAPGLAAAVLPRLSLRTGSALPASPFVLAPGLRPLGVSAALKAPLAPPSLAVSPLTAAPAVAAVPALPAVEGGAALAAAIETAPDAAAVRVSLDSFFENPGSPRAGGVLMHLTSLPSAGIGDMGPEAYRFVDFLKAGGQRYWQVLPLTVTEGGTGHSPYSSLSAFARNTLLISPEKLIEDGWVRAGDVPALTDTPGKIDFEAVERQRRALFDKVWARYQADPRQKAAFTAFQEKNTHWLNDYALFVAIKESQDGKVWSEWPEDLRNRDPNALSAFGEFHAGRVEQLKLLQFLFSEQWAGLKGHAHAAGVALIGDVPIYVGYDSADVWTQPESFQLDEKGAMRYVSGVPPDMFSATGQLWGTPVYDWAAHQRDGYAWWLSRLKSATELVDKVRIDHFRGLVQYWRVPASAKTARAEEGAGWADGPGESFFAALAAALPGQIIAEDLGVITADVVAVMEKFGLPGMRVLQFAFGDEDLRGNPHLPDNHQAGSVVYTGTHDNNTTRGWLEDEASSREKGNIAAYLSSKGVVAPSTMAALAWELVRLAVRSAAHTVILPLQDILGLGSEGRMNRPGTARGNWGWRMEPGALSAGAAERLTALTAESGRR